MSFYKAPALAALLFCPTLAIAQAGGDKSVSFGSKASGGALQGEITYSIPLEPSAELGPCGKTVIAEYAPAVNLRFADGNAFNGLEAKLAGYLMRAGCTTVSGVEVIDTRSYSIIPISLGIETDQSFDNVALIAEAGWMPHRRDSGLNTRRKDGLLLQFGAFAQAGYKFGFNPESESGDGADESAEAADDLIARLKVTSGVEYPLFSFGNSVKTDIWFLGDATGWYDIANNEFYHSVSATFRIGLSDGTNLDFKYEEGSGAPNFNTGDQFGAYLTVAF